MLVLAGLPAEEIVGELARRCPRVKVLVLERSLDARRLYRLLIAGAAGYGLESDGDDEFVRGLRVVGHGGCWLSPAVVCELAGPGAAPTPAELGLTDRQRAALELLVAGKRDREIAQELGIGRRTVRDHLREVYGKLGVQTRAEAAARAVAWGLVRLTGAEGWRAWPRTVAKPAQKDVAPRRET